ncbi:hypothetical protein ACWDAZ_12405 [Streptomyces sp. NPDC001215]
MIPQSDVYLAPGAAATAPAGTPPRPIQATGTSDWATGFPRGA